MEIFSNEVASTLQYFTFPLEVVGLILATIEVRFPEVAARISQFIKHEWANFVEVKEILPQPPFREDYSNMLSWMNDYLDYWRATTSVTIQSLIFFIGFILVPMLIVSTIMFPSITGMQLVEMIFGVLVEFAAGVTPWVFPIVVISVSLWASAKWVEEREVGTLGIIIAGFGVLGEAYQFTTQLVV